MEQRIDRCHRLGQENDVLSVAFIDKHNFSDVRKLELVSKRLLVSDGVFGVSDEVLGGFTTFTQELADKVKLSPRYIDERAEQINETLWELAKWFFTRYNEEHDDCRFVIDESEKTITATAYEKLPVLFYYWDGSRNKRYQSQKKYGMDKGFTPRHGRITLSSIIGRGILHELECADEGRLIVRGSAGAVRNWALPCFAGGGKASYRRQGDPGRTHGIRQGPFAGALPGNPVASGACR